MQDRQCTHDVIFWRVKVIIVAVATQQ